MKNWFLKICFFKCVNLYRYIPAWLENITFQMNTMSKEEQNRKLGGVVQVVNAVETHSLKAPGFNP
jgi:hypothetical protein